MQGAHPLFEGLREERENPLFADFIVTVEDKEFKCHKMILAATSNFFNAILRSGKETEGSVAINGLSAEIFALLLGWMYHDESIVTQENVFDVLQAVDKLQINSQIETAKELLTHSLSLDNCVRVYNVSHHHKWVELKQAAWALMLKNFDRIEQNEFNGLEVDALKSLITDREMVTSSEEVVVEKVLGWVCAGSEWMGEDPDKDKKNDDERDMDDDNNKREEKGEKGGNKENEKEKDDFNDEVRSVQIRTENGRVQYLEELLRSCRYYLVTFDFLWSTLDKDPLVKSSPICQEMLKDIMKYKTRFDSHQHGCPRPALHRESDSLCDVLLCVWENYLNVIFIGLTGLSGNGWKTAKFKFPEQNVTFSGAAFYNGSIYFETAGVDRRRVFKYTGDLDVQLCHCSDNSTKEVTKAFLPVGNSMIAIRSTEGGEYYINTLKLPCKKSDEWVRIGCPSVKGMEVEWVANIGSKLLIFWKNSHPGSLKIEHYDLKKHKSYILQDKLSTSTSVRTFKTGDQVFVLQGDGVLWRLKALEDTPYLKLVLEKQLWTSQEKLGAAMLMPRGLYVKRKKPEPYSDVEWCQGSQSLHGVFADVSDGDFRGQTSPLCYVHALVNKDVFPKK